MSGNSSHSHSTRSRHHLRSTTSGSPPSSQQTFSDASDNSSRTSQHATSRNVSRSRSSHRAAQQLSSPQEQEIGNFEEFLKMQRIDYACNVLLDINRFL